MFIFFFIFAVKVNSVTVATILIKYFPLKIIIIIIMPLFRVLSWTVGLHCTLSR